LIKPYANIAELIESLESEITSLKNTIATLQKEPQSVNEQIIFEYISTRSTCKTKDFVRALNIKPERGSLYSSGDVSKLIKDGADDISSELLGIAKKVVNIKKNSGKNR
jgi:hypothetical protein